MSDAALLDSLATARDTLAGWMECLPEDRRSILRSKAMARTLTRMSYVEGYLRIRHTMSLILRTIGRLNDLGRTREAAFWIEHLGEEAFHDRVMRDDLTRLLGGTRAASAVLRRARITPASAALLGYFEWQVTHGNPSLMIALRLFLEWYIAGLDDWQVLTVDTLVAGGSRILKTHKELDAAHAEPCLRYVANFCRACRSDVEWSIEFAGRCLRDSHVTMADRAAEHCA